MTIPNSHVNPLLAAGIGPQAIRPSREQLAELEVVRGLQIRTEAVKLAIEHAKGEHISPHLVLDTARDIARFIEHGNFRPET